MKLPAVFDNVFGKKEEKKEMFASILLDAEYVATALWEMGENGAPRILATATESVAADTWEDRLNAVDDALAAVEDKAGTTEYAKTVLGLPSTYLTESGEIAKDVRMHVKDITRELALKAIGFVSIHQALMYHLKKDEGVPPSVIFLGISHHTISLSLYKVGELSGQKTVETKGDIAIQVEELLKEFKDLEVLPARILVYGRDGKDLSEVKNDLLKYPWTTRANFLHFPKIEIVTPEEVIKTISLAGASELAHEMQEDVITETAQPETGLPLAEAKDIEAGEEILQEEQNVVVVDPSHFGFQQHVDVLENVEQPKREIIPKKHFSIKFPTIDISGIIARFHSGGILPIIGIITAIVLFGGLIYWFIPHATVTVLESPKSLGDSAQITIDPATTIVDAANKIIPGAKQQLSVSEEKMIAVTGKKNVGDPAKGTVAIFNHTLENQTLKKGTVLSYKSLQFTLDSDMTLSAATKTGTLGSETTTFGQSTGSITASQIGTESNLPINTSFSVQGFSADEMTGNNAAALAGGTSREVTVVSRADYDALVAAAQKDLVDQAKQELTASVSSTAKLIEDTIQTTVTQKTFDQELDQQASQLSGKVTVTVSGISYNDDDVKTLLKAFIAKDIPQGFTLSESRTTVSLTDVVVKKNDTVTATASIKTDAVPTLDIAAIQNNLAGKTIANASAYLRAMPGVAAMEVSFGMNVGKSRLPMNAKNISIKFAIQ